MDQDAALFDYLMHVHIALLDLLGRAEADRQLAELVAKWDAYRAAAMQTRPVPSVAARDAFNAEREGK